jgi:hypothetical protein
MPGNSMIRFPVSGPVTAFLQGYAVAIVRRPFKQSEGVGRELLAHVHGGPASERSGVRPFEDDTQVATSEYQVPANRREVSVRSFCVPGDQFLSDGKARPELRSDRTGRWARGPGRVARSQPRSSSGSPMVVSSQSMIGRECGPLQRAEHIPEVIVTVDEIRPRRGGAVAL